MKILPRNAAQLQRLKFIFPLVAKRALSSEVGGRRYERPSGISYLSVPGELPLSSLTIGQLVDRAAEKFPDNQALVASGHQKTFAQLKTEVDSLAGGFLSLGLKKGDRLGIWGPNSYQWYLAHKAGMKAGLIIVNINPAYQTREIAYCLQKVGVSAVLFSEQFKSSNYYDMLCQTVPALEKSQPGKIKDEKFPQLTTLISMENKEYKGSFSFGEVMDRGSSRDALNSLESAAKAIQFDDVCNIQFTSGTTGNPKGVMLSHHNIVNNGMLTARRFHYTPKDKLCIVPPLFHCLGSVVGAVAALYAGAATVLPPGGFSPSHILQNLNDHRCTVIYGTPTMHIDILNHPDFGRQDVSALRLAVTAGAICPEELVKQMKSKYTVDIVGNCYGLTETSPVICQNLPEDHDQLMVETVGYPLEHTEVKLVNREGSVVKIGEEGELCTRGYMNMLGYWGDPEKTAEAIDGAKWFHTGDLCVMTSTGHVRIVGRLKDVIIRGGENIYPRELEDFFHTHPEIQEAQIFSVPDARMGEEVGAWIARKTGSKLTEEDLKSFCKGKIAHYKIPRYIVFTTEFPKTTSGKLQKFKMREETMRLFNIGEKS